MYKESSQIKELVDQANKILIIQPDNPDGDSLGSAIGLEQILTNLAKEAYMISGVNIPTYLNYISGWDRVEHELPNNFDLSIIVDNSSTSLIETYIKNGLWQRITAKPYIVIDHHQTEASIDSATVRLNDETSAATAEIIAGLASENNWNIPKSGCEALVTAILSDSLGLTTRSTTAKTVRTIADLIESGVSLAELENKRRESNRKSPEIVHFKGKLLERIEYYEDNQIAILTITWPEIEKYSPEYNPAILALEDMRLTTNTKIALILKLYPDNKITGKIRTSLDAPIADKLAEYFGGGGHNHASGFKLINAPEIDVLLKDILLKAKELLNETL